MGNKVTVFLERSCALLFFLWTVPVTGADDVAPAIGLDKDGLVYESLNNGDRVPDYSYCGFASGTLAIPIVTTRLTLRPSGGDDTQAIQAAIDRLASLPIDESGWRGALQLSPETFRVSGSLHLRGSNYVLRGTHHGTERTIISATGISRRPLIVVGGTPTLDTTARHSQPSNARIDAESDRRFSARIVSYVPVGAMRVVVDDGSQWHVGQSLQVHHPSTTQWIAAVGMNRFPNDDGRGSWLDWKPDTLDLCWRRTIVAVDGQILHLDAPLTSAIDPELTPATVSSIQLAGEAHHLGVEGLELISQADTALNPKDEEHAWDAVRLNHVTDAWVRSVSCRQFVGSAVHVGQAARRVTIADCDSSNPISEDAGWRRHTFYTLGEQTLFLRCRAEEGRHDFAVGPLACGPNAFVHCSARRASAPSGPVGSWASGVLFDNVEIDGSRLAVTNRETAAQGTGWAAANCMLWNCVASVIECRRPPTAYNWAIGVWGEVVGDGSWKHLNEFAKPNSLFAAQLAERIGEDDAAKVMSKTEMFSASMELPVSADEHPARVSSHAVSAGASPAALRLKNGWLALGDSLAVGSRLQLSWWRGSVLPAKVSEFGPGLTRFVPGRDEPGYTDSIEEVARQMQVSGNIAIDHHWGLWYDRRRDDHQMVRRIDADAWPPFHEQPWARSGVGQAWDGLSRYDLTRFNPWYFDRLEQFAKQADARGLILIQQMYFQHNVLEAGAHWADFPWRPANCLQDTGFPEPPLYENRKRVFMANDFYDVSHPVRRDLHARYIRHCLDRLGRFSNVLFMLGEEFTGPAHFVRFWLDVIGQWERENDRDVLVVLSTTRDVQELILRDKEYASRVDVIELKYWWYTNDGSIYEPAGGEQLAPRQQLRQWAGSKNRSSESLCRAVRETRLRFPEKAVLCSLSGVDPWQMLAAGGSLPALPATTDQEIRQRSLDCQPAGNGSRFELVFGEHRQLIATADPIASPGYLMVDKKSGRVDTAEKPGHRQGTIQAQSTSDATSTGINKTLSELSIFWRLDR